MTSPRAIAVLTIAALIAPVPLEALAQETKSTTAPAAAPKDKPATAPATTSKSATAPATPKDEKAFSSSQLEQMVAPIALYPDPLLMQILMASTYPLEIVEAARWLDENPQLKTEKDEKKIDEALKKQDWDPSVKSLVKFPDVLAKMNKNLDWTRDIGDGFLGQQTEMLDAVQRMRGKAHEAGNLKSGKEQTVTVQEDKTIVIQQANPEVIYVPSYNPTVVYGSYWPPPVYYPAMYAYPPGAAFFTFSMGMMWGAAMWSGCSWGWGHSNVNVNVNHYNNFNRNTNINGGNNNINGGGRNQVNPNNNRGGGNQSWSHNPEHRKGVNYKDNKTASQFGGSGNSPRVSQNDARGFNSGQRPGGGASASQRPSTGAGGAGGQRPSTGAGGGSRPSTGASSRPSTSNRSSSSAFSGSRNSSFDRASSSRGMSSRSGGGARAGGGGGRRR